MGWGRMPLEDWFDAYQYEVQHNIGESGVRFLNVGDLGLDLAALPLRYGHHSGGPELRELTARDYPGLNPSRIGITTGASEANLAVIASLVIPGYCFEMDSQLRIGYGGSQEELEAGLSSLARALEESKS